MEESCVKRLAGFVVPIFVFLGRPVVTRSDNFFIVVVCSFTAFIRLPHFDKLKGHATSEWRVNQVLKP